MITFFAGVMLGLVFIPLCRTISWHAWQRRDSKVDVLSSSWKQKMIELERK